MDQEEDDLALATPVLRDIARQMGAARLAAAWRPTPAEWAAEARRDGRLVLRLVRRWRAPPPLAKAALDMVSHLARHGIMDMWEDGPSLSLLLVH
jgi:hypothetical protein